MAWLATILHTDDAKSYKWFGGGVAGGLLNIGVYMKDSSLQNGEYGDVIKSANWDGKVHCNNQYLVQDALAFWGLDPITVLCESGFSRDKNGTKDNIGTVASCESTTDNEQAALNFKTNSSVFVKFTSYIKKTIYGDDKTEPSLDIAGTTTPDKQEQAARWYRFYRHSLNESCILNIDSVPPDTNGGLSGPKIYSDVIWVNKDTGEITKGTYTGAYSASESAGIGPIQSGQFDTGGDITMKCSDMVKEMNKNADLYSAWVIAYVKANQTPPPTPVPTVIKSPDTPTTSSCAIGGIGWIVCPVINFVAGIADTAFKFLSDNFLSVSPSLLNTDPTVTDSSGNKIGTGAYTAWQTMRTFANVVLVIAFLAIIFSQLTSFGITNYGIKKLLPKLIFVAVLINISFLICQVAVDVSNILGYSLKSLLTNIAGTAVSIPDVASTFKWSDTAVTVLGGSTAAGLGVAAAGGITMALVALIGMLIAAVIALMMIFIILIVRQMLIILMVVMAPLAFAAYLLPNTKNLFDKWQKLFTQMLILFPVIGLIFGGSTLASAILKSAWAGSGNTVAQIVAAGVLVLPLFLVPTVLKGALSGIGAIGSKIGGLGSQWGSSANRRVTSGYANSGFNKFNQAKKAENAARASAGNYRGSNPFRKLQSFASGRRNESRVFNSLTGGYGASQFLTSQGQNRKDMADAISMFNSDDDLIEAWADTGGDIAAARTWTGSSGKTLTDTQIQQMQRMRDAGHHRKSTSFLAAASAMSTGGKGSTAAIASALGNAARAGASATDTDSAWQTSLAAYRGSGRGDIVGEMSAHFTANANATPLGIGHLTATPAAITASQLTGWGQVSASSVHRNAIDPVNNPAGAASYQTFLNGDAENTRQALAGYDQMEARAKVLAQPDIITAAQIHESHATGMASTITNIQDAKAYFGIR